MARTDALAAYAMDRLAAEPLTSREVARGSALRLVSCVRANDADLKAEPSGFVWSVLAFSRGASPQPDGPATVRLGGLSELACRLLAGGRGSSSSLVARATLPADAALPAVGQPGVLPADGAEPWQVAEYALEIPRPLRAFTVTDGRSSIAVGRNLRNALIRAHFESIANAAADDEVYARWFEAHRRDVLAKVETPEQDVLVSIVCPIYKTPPEFLRAALASVAAQTYGNWELVAVNASPDDEGVRGVLAEFAGDPRVRVLELERNEGIVGNTNAGIAQTRGDYVCFLDHDDFVEPQALAAMVGEVKRYAAACGHAPDLVYCDEDSINEEGRFRMPLFKPGLNRDLLYSNDYVIHWLMVSRSALDRTARSGKEVEGAQDYDLTLKTFEVSSDVTRVPLVLYHWRIHEGSMNSNPASKLYAQESGRRAIAESLARQGVEGATVEREPVVSTYRTTFAVPDPRPSLACAVMGEPSGRLLAALEAYAAAVPGSEAPAIMRLPADASADEVLAFVRDCRADLGLLVAGGLGMGARDLELLAGYFSRRDVFSASPRTLLRGGLVDCAGCVVAPDGGIVRMGRCLPDSDEGYIGRLHRPYSAAVLDADCWMFRPARARELGPDPAYETVSHTVADMCLKAYAAGETNAFAQFSVASWDVGRSLLVGDPAFSPQDRALLLRNHAALLSGGDPSHNPNFDPRSPHYRLRAAE